MTEKKLDYKDKCKKIRVYDKETYDFGKKVKCHRCEYEWIYRGTHLNEKNPYPAYTSCPKCRTSVKIK